MSQGDMFSIEFLDHVAIRVKDLDRAAIWYEKILGLKRVQPPEWKPWPIFMLAGNSGVAIFPEKEGHTRSVDHFAFRVDETSFERARQHLNENGVEYRFQDHTYFHSIYFQDPDGHTVELTVPTRPLKS